MLIVISPAKTLDCSLQKLTKKFTEPQFLDEAEMLVKKMRKMSAGSLSELMSISDELAQLARERFTHWSRPFTPTNAKQALLAFRGEAYTGLAGDEFRAKDFSYAQDHLRILSGLYGTLRPLDLIQPYRLEMGTKIATRSGKHLYDFWGDKIFVALSDVLATHKHPALVNLASNEYFKSVRPHLRSTRIITPIFKEIKGGKSRTIATFAKRARGVMASWIIRSRVENPNKLPEFSSDGYEFIPDESSKDRFVFARLQPAPPRGR